MSRDVHPQTGSSPVIFGDSGSSDDSRDVVRVARPAGLRTDPAATPTGGISSRGAGSSEGEAGIDDFAGDPFDAPEDFAGDPEERSPSGRVLRVAVEWLLVVACSLGLALLLRTHVVEVFSIPSSSMAPTLEVDDRVAVYKLGYNFHSVNRGDVVVFKAPGPSSDIDDLIKRVVAESGETFELKNGAVYIDGERLDEPYLPAGRSTHPRTPIPGCLNPPNLEICTVPDGMVLVLGDNREFSRDSRYFGPVDTDDVVGRAFMKIWPPGNIGGV